MEGIKEREGKEAEGEGKGGMEEGMINDREGKGRRK